MKNSTVIKPGMRVAVMGLGVSGRSAVQYGLTCGARVVVSDSRKRSVFAEESGPFLQALGVDWEAGGHTVEFLEKAELVIVSPGIPSGNPVLKSLQARNIPCLGELAVAAPHLDVPVIAITGTNGKTTVTTMVGDLLRESGKRVFVGGNIGTPLFDYLLGDHEVDFIVLEVSSFQLYLAGSFAPEVALLLNITPDHLDWHQSVDGYVEAKMQIFRNQRKDDTAIISGDDSVCRSVADRITGRLLTFGHDVEASATITGSNVTLFWHGEEESYNLGDTGLASPIGAMNSAAAILAVRSVGVAAETVRAGLNSFQPLPNRLQQIRELAGVSYVNDSKATNTGAVIAALGQLTGKAVLIAGGKHKGEDYSLLYQSVKEKARRVILIGEAAKMIGDALAGATEVEYADSMKEAVDRARLIAVPGDTVLLSPACASFDMFRSYGHRGGIFMDEVMALEPVEENPRQENV